MELSFHGASGGVTGSSFLLQACGKQILIDCGMFQGEHNLEEENRANLGFDPRRIDVLMLTHAHLDRCGRIPLLVKQGFRGEIITTSATRELARLVLIDTAGPQVEEAKRAARRHLRRATLCPPLFMMSPMCWMQWNALAGALAINSVSS